MRAIIIDDEVSCIESLSAKIEMFVPQVKLVKTFILPQEAIREVNKLDIDLVFLDVEMPNLNGISFVKKANLQNTEVIFTTAHQKYAADAFRVCAFDFLLKPIDRHELVESIGRLSQKLEEKHIKFSKLQTKYNKITVHTAKGMLFVPMQNIVWLESDKNYTTLHLAEGPPIIASRPIGEFEEMLVEFDFCRINHTYIINLLHLQEYIRGEGGSVILTNGKELEVSRRRKADLMVHIS